jgi:regulatory protein
VAELQQHGVKGEALAELKAGLKDTEVARAREVWRRKFNRVPQDAEERSKQMRFLMQRGFSQGAVRSALQGRDEDDE